MPVVRWQVAPPQSELWRQALAESQNPPLAVQVPDPSSQQPLAQSAAELHSEQTGSPPDDVPVLPVLPVLPVPPQLQVWSVVSHWMPPPQSLAVAQGLKESQ